MHKVSFYPFNHILRSPVENIPQHWIDIVDTETNITTSMEPVSIEKLLVLGEILTQNLDIFEIGRTL